MTARAHRSGTTTEAGGEGAAVTTYVLDTSVLLSDPGALRRFAEHEVVLPLVVIGELEGKRAHPELGWFARQALHTLDDLRIAHGRLDTPLPLTVEGGTLRVELNHTDPRVLPAGFRVDDNDSRILAVAMNLAAEGRRVVLVSKDLPLRVKAASVGLPAQEYRAELAVDAGWTGLVELDVAPADVDALYATGRCENAEAAELPTHSGLVLMSGTASALGRVLPDKSVQLVRGDREVFGVHGRSAEQRIAIDLLLDPDIGIVSLGGRAGTGKSALALCAGLEAVLERRAHKKIVVFRPLYAVGGQELGYLPGDAAEKMGPWAQAVFDTLGALVEPTRGHGGDRARAARGAAADPHPRPLPARLLRHRRRGPVARARRAAHGALPARTGLAGGADPRRRPARQPPGRPARRGRRRDRGAEGAPALRPHDPDPLRAVPDRGARHRDARGPAFLTVPLAPVDPPGSPAADRPANQTNS